MSNRDDSQYFRHYGEIDNPTVDMNGQEFNGDSGSTLFDTGVNRRTFMTVLSASMAMAAASCRRPEHKLVASTNPTEYLVPGLPNFYTSVYQHKNAAIGLVIKTREGRPIKIDGNPKHTASLGRSSAFVQGTLLSLYDPDRIRRPRVNGGDSSINNAANTIAQAIQKTIASGKKAVFLIDEHCSPAYVALCNQLSSVIPGISVITLPTLISNAPLAHDAVFGVNAELVPDLSKADVIVSVDYDFLGTDKHSVYHTASFSSNRKPTADSPSMNALHSIEASFSLTGANADHRHAVQPSEFESVLAGILSQVYAAKGLAMPSGMQTGANNDAVGKTAKALLSAKNGVVLVGSHLSGKAIAYGQLINQALGSVGEGKPVNLNHRLYNSGDATASISAFRSALKNKEIGSIVYVETNPEYCGDSELKKLLAENVDFSAALSVADHETAQTLCSVSVPTTHYLESWGDAINFDGAYSIQQPIIAPLNQSAISAQDFMILVANFINASSFADTPTFYDFIRKMQSDFASKSSWEQLLRDGVHQNTTAFEAGTPGGIAQLSGYSISGGLTLAITPSYALLDGSQSNNSWLQELPDPITKVTWGNVAMMSKQTAESLGAVQGEVLRFSTQAGSIELPVFIQPGMTNNVVSIGLGYGRTSGGKVLEGVGANAYSILTPNAGYYISAKAEKVGRSEKIATTQGHHAIERYDKPSPFDNEWKERTKDILGVQEGYITLASLAAAKGGSHEDHGHDAHHIADTLSIVDGFQYTGHRWAMAIDLSACTGCSACVVACQAENNIPTVGKKYVANSREMHWIRIDRYYREDASGNVTTVFQPMLCQHCENAPCENVCPVAATTHSPEGLNEMTYNRCVGTRYCLNNCPYKVRRFNFLNWHKDKKTPLDMAFNPDVSVRMRGVMEKCTFCVQRLNEAKMHAKDQGHSRVQDGEVVTACQQACPAGAIIFGDVNDSKSAVAKAATINRGNHSQEYKEKNGAYKVLSELNVRPSVTYLVKVRNTDQLPKV